MIMFVCNNNYYHNPKLRLA